MPSPYQFLDHEDYLKYCRDYREKNKEKFREYGRKYNKKWRQKNGYHNELRAKLKFPEKEKCRRQSSYLVKIGKITRKPCFNCKSVKSEKHHPDYTNPYHIIWCCRQCHTDIHKGKLLC